MRLMGLAAIYQKPNTSRPAPENRVYPYLLRGLAIERPSQVWAADITYIPMARGFLYLVVILDWFSRAVLAWRLSNTCTAEFCVDALEDALADWPAPDIFNSERGAPLVRATARTQGSQFTSQSFTGVLEDHGVRISMDGKGRFMDNIFVERLWRSLKYEEVYLKAYDGAAEARAGIGAWLAFYNTERPHQALGYKTPREVFDGATRPVDKWKAAARLPTSPQAQQHQQIKTDSKEGKTMIPSSRMPQLQSVGDRIQVGGSLP